jgi:hypothetical protein
LRSVSRFVNVTLPLPRPQQCDEGISAERSYERAAGAV